MIRLIFVTLALFVLNINGILCYYTGYINNKKVTTTSKYSSGSCFKCEDSYKDAGIFYKLSNCL